MLERISLKEPSTGSTPKKRKWIYPQTWESVGNTAAKSAYRPPVNPPRGSEREEEPMIVDLGVIEDEIIPSQPALIHEHDNEASSIPSIPLSKKSSSKLPGLRERPPLNVVHNGIPGRLR